MCTDAGFFVFVFVFCCCCLFVQASLSTLPGLDALSMRTVLLQFDRLIASPDAISAALSGAEKIASPRLQSTIHAQVVSLLLAAYESMYDAVADPRHRYGAVDAIAPRTPAQVKIVLGN